MSRGLDKYSIDPAGESADDQERKKSLPASCSIVKAQADLYSSSLINQQFNNKAVPRQTHLLAEGLTGLVFEVAQPITKYRR